MAVAVPFRMLLAPLQGLSVPLFFKTALLVLTQLLVEPFHLHLQLVNLVLLLD